ncbi:MAG: hypothetical protein LRZ85_08305 [Alphaproteobacteria bacterium]|nr:hypothetical protein [Alphaproteobacteria bacterium]MCD8525644.1 hypothetical protein [Alphaproteobacteria bacterium]MCD8570046.1 hypothetical protein [Alphaproteobacteria bacterium]
MIGFDPLTVTSLLVLAASQPTCTAPQPAQIKVTPRTADVQLITSHTLGDLQTVQTDTINPHSFGGVSYLQGFASGRIAVNPSVKLNYTQDKRSGAVCLYYETVNIEIAIDPKIYIAKEVYDDRCMGKATYDHEMKHVMTDRVIVNKYANVMGQKVLAGLQERGFVAGPFYKSEHVTAAAERMQHTVFQLLEREYKRLELDREDAQGEVDSIEEYDRVDALCPDFKEMPQSLEAYYATKKKQ